MIRGTTRSGFDFEMNEDLLDDFELVELFAKVNENIMYVPALGTKLLGAKQFEALKEHLRGEDGRVKSTDMFDAIADVEAAFPESKN